MLDPIMYLLSESISNIANGCSYDHRLHDNNDAPYRQGALLTKTLVEYLSHGLANVAVQEYSNVTPHAKCQNYINRWDRG